MNLKKLTGKWKKRIVVGDVTSIMKTGGFQIALIEWIIPTLMPTEGT